MEEKAKRDKALYDMILEELLDLSETMIALGASDAPCESDLESKAGAIFLIVQRHYQT